MDTAEPGKLSMKKEAPVDGEAIGESKRERIFQKAMNALLRSEAWRGGRRSPCIGGIVSFMKDFAKKSHQGYLIHPRDALLPLGENIRAVPFSGI